MTGEQDTGNSARLPYGRFELIPGIDYDDTSLEGRAKCGFLAYEPELGLREILKLEFPTGNPSKGPTSLDWLDAIDAAVQFGLLVSTHNGWVYSQDSYRTWRATQADPPARSIVHLWLGAAPTPAAPTLPQGEPDKPQSGAAAKKAALAQLLDELDKRAVERGAEFDRHSLPGTKDEFAMLLKSHCPIFRHIGTATIADYLKGKCKFQRGAQPEQGKGKAVWALFSEYDLK